MVNKSIFLVTLLVAICAVGDGDLAYAKAFVLAFYLFVLRTLLLLKKPGLIILFYIGFGIFMLGKVFLEVVFDFGSMGKVNYFISLELSPETEYLVLFNISLAILGTYFSTFIKIPWKPRVRLLNLGFEANRFVLALGFIVVGKYFLDRAGFVSNVSYDAMYTESFAGKGIVAFVFEQILWLILFSIIASSRNSKKKTRFYILLALFLLILEIASGRRGTVAANILVLIFYLSYLGFIKMTYIKTLIGILIAIFGLNLIKMIRSNDLKLQEDSGGGLLLFFDQQGSSVFTICYPIEYSDEKSVKNYGIKNLFSDPLIYMDKLKRRLKNQGNPSLEEQLKQFGYSGHVITDLASVDLLQEGKSTGTSCLAELWMVGGEFAVFIGFLILGFILRAINFSSPESTFLALMIGPDLIYLPRASFGSVLMNNFLFFFIVVIWYFLKRRKDV